MLNKPMQEQSYLSIEEKCLPELFQALIRKDLSKLNLLLDTRPLSYICVKDRKNRTCLHYAAFLGYAEILNCLLKRERSAEIINGRDNSGKTPLLKAVESNTLPCIELLLKHEASTSCQDDNGITPLHVATLAGKLQTMKMLVENVNKADVNMKDKLGFTPLHLSAGLGLVDGSVFLIKNGADPNATDEKGRTPLFAACTEKKMDVVEILIVAGADESIVDSRGRTASLSDKISSQVLASLKNQSSENIHTKALSPVIETSETQDVSSIVDPPSNRLNGATPMIGEVQVNAVEIPMALATNWSHTNKELKFPSRTTTGNNEKENQIETLYTRDLIWDSILERPCSTDPNNNTSPCTRNYNNKNTTRQWGQRATNIQPTFDDKCTRHNREDNVLNHPYQKGQSDSKVEVNKDELSAQIVQDDNSNSTNGTRSWMDEDRYRYLCYKNRELLRRKIKRCEALESKMIQYWNELHREEKQINSSRYNDASVNDSMLQENHALRNEVNSLLQKNAQLNEELTDYKHQLIFNEKTNGFPMYLGQRNNSSGDKVSDKDHDRFSVGSQEDESCMESSFHFDNIKTNDNKILDKIIDDTVRRNLQNEDIDYTRNVHLKTNCVGGNDGENESNIDNSFSSDTRHVRKSDDNVARGDGEMYSFFSDIIHDDDHDQMNENQIPNKSDLFVKDEDRLGSDTIRSDRSMLNKSIDDVLTTSHHNNNHTHHNNQVDPDFQNTINKFIRENILMKRAYKQFEEAYVENLKQLDEAEQEIQNMARRDHKHKKVLNERNQLVQELEELENDYEELKYKYKALRRAMSKLNNPNYDLKDYLETNDYDMEKFRIPLTPSPIKDLGSPGYSGCKTFTSYDQPMKPPKPPPPVSKTAPPQKPQRPKSPLLAKYLNLSKEDTTNKPSIDGQIDNDDENRSTDGMVDFPHKVVKKKKRFWMLKKPKH